MIVQLPDWSQSLGWALLHSLWQGLLIMLVVALIVRLIPSKNSALRYTIACSGMILIALASVMTFILLQKDTTSVPRGIISGHAIEAGQHSTPDVSFALTNALYTSMNAIHNNMNLIILAWVGGTLLFSLRLVSGWWYISRLRSESVFENNQWERKLQQLAMELHIDKPVRLAESIRVHAPMVIGFVKPIVLVPVGMLAGLSVEQVEAIFIHELAHIRRHDYLINLAQSLMESLFFFNPFVWIISSIIRREREYCCDDAVLKRQGLPLVYAHALTQLEEKRLSRSVFAVSLAENKNLLLNRIRRIMEKSAKSYAGKDRLIPVVLFVIGLGCASWLTVSTEGNVIQEKRFEDTTETAGDTLRKPNEKSARYSRKTIITYDENGEPHEETVEEFEGDEELKPIMPDFSTDFPSPPSAMLPPQWAESFVLPAPPLPDFEELMAPFGAFNFHLDSVPPSRSEKDWHSFQNEFENKFREEFGDFYKAHEEDFDKMMKELEEKFGDDFSDQRGLSFNQHWNSDFGLLQKELENLKHLDNMEHLKGLGTEMEKMNEVLRKLSEANGEWEREHHENFGKLQREMELNQKHLLDVQRGLEENMESFNQELAEQLIKDGYLKAGEKVKNISWDDDGEIEINGKKIKDADRDKYDRIHDRHFKSSGHFRYVE